VLSRELTKGLLTMLKKVLFALFAVLLLIIVLVSLPSDKSVARQSKEKPNWQASQSVAGLRLGIREKDGVIEPFDAMFIVTDSNGKEFKVTKRVETFMFGYVNFPNDFGGYAPSDSYRWKCIVNDEVVVEGRFEYTHNSILIDDDALKFLPNNDK
jgi:hypothetical protein